MKISLHDLDWQLQGYWAHEPLLTLTVETGSQFLGVTDPFPARVPGSVHDDLLRAKLIEDPRYELNSLQCEWVEHRWWVYSAVLRVGAEHQGKSIRLTFDGVDYRAHFFLGRTKLGEHEGMFTPAVFDVSGHLLFGEDNHLRIAVEAAPAEMSQIGYTSKSSTQKARFNYKWDFCTRMVNLGLWGDVYLDITGPARLGERYVSTDWQDSNGIVETTVKVRTGQAPAKLKTQLFFADALVEEKSSDLPADAADHPVRERFVVANPKLWFPNGAGVQPLYRLVIAIEENGVVADACEQSVGIRSLAFRRNDGAGEDSLPYTIVVNGGRIYMKGVNFTPADLLYGTVGRDAYRRHLTLMREMNVNLIRVWGGGLIEKEVFYELCDELGLLVWQEFIQSGSGLENVPGKDPRFLALLSGAATHAVKTRRNHVSLAVWSGGNELMDEQKVPSTVADANLAMLLRIVEEHDPGRLFLPTSASGPREFGSSDPADRGTNHDVHGQWKYLGIEEHYRQYGAADSLLHSEFGVDGCAPARSLKKFLGPKNLRPVSMRANRVWRHHGEWWDVYERQLEFFGPIKDLTTYALASQFVQAEGLRFVLEANRRREGRNSGSIIWQFNEPWPNVSCTSLVDYYFEPKIAYYATKNAFAPRAVSLAYPKLRFDLGEEFAGEIHVHNSQAATQGRVAYEILALSGEKLGGEETAFEVEANASRFVQALRFKVAKTPKGIFFVRLRLWDASGAQEAENVYVFSTRRIEYFAPLLSGEKEDLKLKRLPGSSWQFRITNRGKRACAGVHLVEKSGEFYVRYNLAYTTLFPGESCEVTAVCEAKSADTGSDGPEFKAAAL